MKNGSGHRGDAVALNNLFGSGSVQKPRGGPPIQCYCEMNDLLNDPVFWPLFFFTNLCRQNEWLQRGDKI